MRKIPLLSPSRRYYWLSLATQERGRCAPAVPVALRRSLWRMPFSSRRDNADKNPNYPGGQRPHSPLSAEGSHAPTTVQAEDNGPQSRTERGLPEPPASTECQDAKR